MKFCTQCGTQLYDENRFCPCCGMSCCTPDEYTNQTVDKPITKSPRKDTERILIIAMSIVILFALVCVPIFESTFWYSAPTLSDIVEISQGPEYTSFKIFVDFVMVVFFLALAVLVSGIFKWNSVSLALSLMVVLYAIQMYSDISNANNRVLGEIVQISMGYWIIVGANIVVFVCSLKNIIKNRACC